MASPVRLLLAAAALLAGGATGLAAVALHRLSWGLPLAAVAIVVTLVALRPGWWSRLAFGAGIALLVGLAVLGRPEGDYAVSSDGRGYALVGLALLVVVVVVATLPPPGRARESRHVSRDQPDPT